MNINVQKLANVIANLPETNQKFIVELLGLIQSVGFGTITPSIELHRSRVTKAEFRGWKRIKYSTEDKGKAIHDLGDRIGQAIQNKRTTKLHFVIDVKRGEIKNIYWDSIITREY